MLEHRLRQIRFGASEGCQRVERLEQDALATLDANDDDEKLPQSVQALAADLKRSLRSRKPGEPKAPATPENPKAKQDGGIAGSGRKADGARVVREAAFEAK